MWVWIAVGVGSFLGLSVLVSLVVARVLGTIAGAVSELYENEAWARLPPSRALRSEERSLDASRDELLPAETELEVWSP